MEENRSLIEDNRAKYEKYRLMCDLINEIQQQGGGGDIDSEEEGEDIETHDPAEIKDFEKWAASQASKELANLKDMTDASHLRKDISSLNSQQRRCFDDFCERVAEGNVDEPPFYIFISGGAGVIITLPKTIFNVSSFHFYR